MVDHPADSHAARLLAVLEAAVDAIISIDSRGLIQMMNPAAERMFGYSAGEAVGQNVKLLMPSPYREEHDGYLARYLATGEKRIIGIGREAVGQRKDGTTFPIDLSVAESRSEGQPVFVGIIRDITERKRINEEVRSMTQQLWHAAKLASVGELAASIAHELNNPLATVCLRVESVLNRTPADDPRRKALEVISQETQRMADLVSNLLQFSRRGHGQVSTVDVRDELSKAIDLIQHHLQKHSIRVSRDFGPDTPTVHADRQKLRQVFLNLLTNASDAMPTGGRLLLRTQGAQLTDGECGLLIEISDSGVGIAPEHLERVMEPFFTTKEEGKGTGLGLAICRRIVQEHQGQIRIESRPGAGTTVRITMPVWTDGNVSLLRGGREKE
jgi:PAS domain S-box-containing protein